jgi:hypothetical protein
MDGGPRVVAFQKHKQGVYTVDMIKEDWKSSYMNSDASGGRVDIVRTSGTNRSLRVTYPKGSTVPVLWKSPLTPRDDYVLEFRVAFHPRFDWRNGGKLPGLVGGSAPTGGKDASRGFSARYMWRAGGRALLYLYWQGKRATFGDELYFTKGFKAGKWHRLRQYVKLNTPGVSDGILKVWLDGELVHDGRYTFRKLHDQWKIDAFYFNTMFGGKGHKWEPTKDEYIYFDNFIISAPSALKEVSRTDD